MAVEVRSEAALRPHRPPVRVQVSGGWTVTSSSSRPDDVRLDVVDGVLRLTVEDGGGNSRERTTVVLQADGEVTVDAGAMPPALLVSPRSARTLPAVPGVPETVRFDTGQRLLVLSADALDALPESLVHVLQALPEQVTGREPAVLLGELFADLPGGSGVIVARRPALVPATGTDQEEATWGSAQHS
ncbi:hypothetical protein GCM10027446_10810 [Angustibacter peucedani]